MWCFLIFLLTRSLVWFVGIPLFFLFFFNLGPYYGEAGGCSLVTCSSSERAVEADPLQTVSVFISILHFTGSLVRHLLSRVYFAFCFSSCAICLCSLMIEQITFQWSWYHLKFNYIDFFSEMFIRKFYQERDKLIKLLQGPLLIATLFFLLMLIMVRDFLENCNGEGEGGTPSFVYQPWAC